MRIPPDLMANTATALAFVAFVLSFAGAAACVVLYASAYMALGSIDATVSPQFDSAEAALSDASASLYLAANSSAYASDALSSVSGALQSYSDSTSALSSSLDGVASIPPFSLEPRLQAAAGDMRQASLQFANASQSAAQMSISAKSAVLSVESIASSMGSAASKMSEAKRNYHSAMSGISLMALIFCLCLLALFSSVALVSLSLMLSHYPDLLKRAEASAAASQQKK